MRSVARILSSLGEGHSSHDVGARHAVPLSKWALQPEPSPRSGRKDHSPRWSRQAEPWVTDPKTRQALKGRQEQPRGVERLLLDTMRLAKGSGPGVSLPLRPG
jgi:hypothetical protein